MAEKVEWQTIYWRDGKRDVFPGATPAQALSSAGYGAGAVSAIDFICAGDNDEYERNAAGRRWGRTNTTLAARETKGE